MNLPTWIRNNGIQIAVGTLLGATGLCTSLWIMRHDRTTTIRPASPTAQVNGHTFHIRIAQTPTEQAKGLGGIQMLNPDEGMYFPFPEPKVATFWMKDMRFPIDLLWIKNGTIIGIEHNLPIPSQDKPLPTWTSPEPVDAVLEILAGTAEQLHLQVGNVVTYPSAP